MKDGLFFNGPSSWSDFHGHASLKFSVESLGPLVGCNPNVDQEEWACTKRERVDFFNTSPKRAFLKKRSLTILLSSLGLQLSSLLDMSKLWLANLLTTIFTKRNEQFNLYMFNIIYMWHVPYVVTIIKLCKKKNRNCFHIAVLLTTMICNR